MNIRVPYVNLGLRNKTYREEVIREVIKVLDRGEYILGRNVSAFEDNFAGYCNTRFAVGVNSGTEALFLSMRAMGIGSGDEVITVPNSFIASASAIALTGAIPVFVDVDWDMNIDPSKIGEVITERTKAVLPVHLTGRPCKIDRIMEIANRYNLLVIEDCAQAIGAEFNGKKVGTFGAAGCFSLHPLKNLNAAGDGGIIITDDETLFKKLRLLRNHGLMDRDHCAFWGFNSRLDEIQAAILNVKLRHLDNYTIRVREIAKRYNQGLCNLVIVPEDEPNMRSVFHTYVIQTEERDELQQFLYQQGIETKVHYPIPIHLQESAGYLGYQQGSFPVCESLTARILSLPIYPELDENQIDWIIESIHKFFHIHKKIEKAV